jgi:hypothetical protein
VNASPLRNDARVPRLAGASEHAILKGMSWLVSRKAAERLPIWRYTLLYACIAILSVATAAAIGVLIFHMPRTGSLGIRRWLLYGIFYTVFFTGFALLGRHMRTRRRQQ